jgi:hypothetical protein
MNDIQKYKIHEIVCDEILEYSKDVNWILASENPKRWIYDIDKDNLKTINLIKKIIIENCEIYLDRYRSFDSDKQIGQLNNESIKFLRLTKYDINSHFPSHIDVSKEHDKDLTVVLYLNKEISSITFPSKDMSYDNSKGDMIVFPSYFNFPHVTNKCDFEKIVLVCWIKLNLGYYL